MKGSPWTAKGVIATLTGLHSLIAPGSGHTVHLCSGTITISGPKATGRITLNNATAGADIWKSNATQTAVSTYAGHFAFDYGETGIALTSGKTLAIGEETATQTAYYFFNGYVL